MLALGAGRTGVVIVGIFYFGLTSDPGAGTRGGAGERAGGGCGCARQARGGNPTSVSVYLGIPFW